MYHIPVLNLMSKIHNRFSKYFYIKVFLIKSILTLSSVTYDILPNGAKAAFISSVVISGLRSPTKTWKWSYKGKEGEVKRKTKF